MKILQKDDFLECKKRVSQVISYLPSAHLDILDKIVYEGLDFDHKNIDPKYLPLVKDLQLLTSARYQEAIELRDGLASVYNRTLSAKGEQLSLKQLIKRCKVSTSALADVVNLSLIKLDQDVVEVEDNTPADLIDLFLTKTQIKVLLEYCILGHNPQDISLPQRATRAQEITDANITTYVVDIANAIAGSKLHTNI